ncbi:MAG: BrxA/BrxB family bacilliredoxin [Chlorobi bacterium]|nr:BrxA/BrxB family bacilliredoxin [Chlorobiota bacterium]
MYNINVKPPIYDSEAIQPMRDELIYVGFEEMRTPQKVNEILSVNDDKTKLVFINSVCGCSAGSARPGVTLALQHSKIPHKLVTSFAGNDRDAVDFIREKYLAEYTPSSPAMAIIKNGETLYHMGRHEIIEKSPEEISQMLIEQFEKLDGRQGPSITNEKHEMLVHSVSCGSKIPLNQN